MQLVVHLLLGLAATGSALRSREIANIGRNAKDFNVQEQAKRVSDDPRARYILSNFLNTTSDNTKQSSSPLQTLLVVLSSVAATRSTVSPKSGNAIKLSNNRFMPFDEARDYVRALKLGGQTEWKAWASTEERPTDIPSHPHVAYKTTGWLSWPDWLGYGRDKSPSNQFLPFEKAREYARALELGSLKEWQEWCKHGERPDNIPSHPERTYKIAGWISWPDWMGYPKRDKSRYRSGMLPFVEAREYARALQLGHQTGWQKWCNSGARPRNIPHDPHVTYRTTGWLSWPDWLGYGKGKLPRNVFLQFEDARKYARAEKLGSQTEWVEWCRSGLRPDNIPRAPQITYKTTGWLSWSDWLGNGEEPSNVKGAGARGPG